MQGIVGGVEIKRDLRGRLAMGVEEQIDEQRLDGLRIVADPVIPRGIRTAELQPVQRRLAPQWRAARTPCRELAGEDGEHRVMAQLVMIDQVLVAERDADHPLQQERAQIVLDVIGGAPGR